MQRLSENPGTAAPAHDLVGTFASVATNGPERVALFADGVRVTYEQLHEWSDCAMEVLRGRGVRRGDRVALRMIPSAEAIVAMLGILKAGAAYVPLDIRNPPARNEFILYDCGAGTLVGELIDNSFSGAVVTTAEVAALRGQRTVREKDPALEPQDSAYIIYTSGTTGDPKGVPIQHSNVTDLFTSASTVFDFTEQDRWLLFHSLAFDFSVWEIWGALSTGAALVMLPYWSVRTPEQYLKIVLEQGVTVLNQTPTAFTALAEAAVRGQYDLRDLRYVIFGGERLIPAGLKSWSERFGLDRPRLVNGYGITETTIFTTFHQVTEQDLLGSASRIGVALPGFRVRVVDENGADVAGSETGELWLAGPQVSNGYLNLADLTAERFPTVADPNTGELLRYYRSGDLVSRAQNGDLLYEGRADLQVKLRGYRIELSDIEAAVRQHEAVVDSVVSVHEFKTGDLRLVCAYVARDGQAPSPRELRDHVKELLPSYMHPARYVCLPKMPSTINGKVDRAAVNRSVEAELRIHGKRKEGVN